MFMVVWDTDLILMDITVHTVHGGVLEDIIALAIITVIIIMEDILHTIMDTEAIIILITTIILIIIDIDTILIMGTTIIIMEGDMRTTRVD